MMISNIATFLKKVYSKTQSHYFNKRLKSYDSYKLNYCIISGRLYLSPLSMCLQQFEFSSQLTGFGQKSKVYLKCERSIEEAQKQNGVIPLVLSCSEAAASPGADGKPQLLMLFAHVNDGLHQLEIHLISDDPSPTLPLWRDELYLPIPHAVQMHSNHSVSCLQEKSDPD